jgi:hypothetical protein
VAVYRMGDTEEGEIGDVWKGKFGPDNSPFILDIAEGEEVVIDISQTGGGSTP